MNIKKIPSVLAVIILTTASVFARQAFAQSTPTSIYYEAHFGCYALFNQNAPLVFTTFAATNQAQILTASGSVATLWADIYCSVPVYFKSL